LATEELPLRGDNPNVAGSMGTFLALLGLLKRKDPIFREAAEKVRLSFCFVFLQCIHNNLYLGARECEIHVPRNSK